MKKFLLLTILLFTSCTPISYNTSNISFSDNMTFEEFKNELINYDKMNSHPNINN